MELTQEAIWIMNAKVQLSKIIKIKLYPLTTVVAKSTTLFVLNFQIFFIVLGITMSLKHIYICFYIFKLL